MDEPARSPSSDVERWRRSIAMLAPGHPAGALGKTEAEALLAELVRLEELTDGYREVARELRRRFDEVEGGHRPPG